MKVQAVNRTNIRSQLDRHDKDDSAFQKYIEEAMKRKPAKK